MGELLTRVAAAPTIPLIVVLAMTLGLVLHKAAAQPPHISSKLNWLRWTILAGVGFSLGFGAMVFAQTAASQAPPEVKDDYTFKALMVTTAGTVITILITQIFQMINSAADRREKREQREFDAAERDRARVRLEGLARAQYDATVATAVEVTKVNEEHVATLVGKIDENTALTRAATIEVAAALNAANDFKGRLEKLRQEVLEKAEKPGGAKKAE